MTYKPKIIHYDGEGAPHWQFVERDVPTVTGQVFAANVEKLTDFDGNLVGFTIYEPHFPQQDLTGRVEVSSITSDRTSPSPIVDEMTESRARALALLQAEDERQDKIHELLETIREQIRVDVAPEHRPEGLMTNIQNAVYAMRGRMRLMNDAAITSPLQPPSAALTSPPKAGTGERDGVIERCAREIDQLAVLLDQQLEALDTDREFSAYTIAAKAVRALKGVPIYATPEPRGDGVRVTDEMVTALKNYDRAVEWHSYSPHNVDREDEQHRAAAMLAEAVRAALNPGATNAR